MTLGERGTRVVAESTLHILAAEEGGFAYVCGLIPHAIESRRGVPDPAALDAALAGAQFGHALRTSLICLENSHNNAGGIAVTPEQTAAIAAVARRHAVPVHLDGARLFNAAVALGVPARDLAAPVDTVAISLNKGLSAPVGALLCGPRPAIDTARINLRRLGSGSIHKAGIWAAAGLVALRTMIPQLGDDNRRAAQLAAALAEIPGLRIDRETVQTNIVVAELASADLPASAFVERLAQAGVLALARSPRTVRFVTHRLIGDAEVQRTADAVAAALG
jgi:threonine aldolase